MEPRYLILMPLAVGIAFATGILVFKRDAMRSAAPPWWAALVYGWLAISCAVSALMLFAWLGPIWGFVSGLVLIIGMAGVGWMTASLTASVLGRASIEADDPAAEEDSGG